VSQLRSHSFRTQSSPPQPAAQAAAGLDVKLKLRGKNGGSMVMEVDSEVLGANSEVFAGLIADCKRGGGGATMEVENLGVFSDTIELMFEEDDCITKRLINFGVFRSIDILEVPISSPFDLCSFYLHSQVFRLTKWFCCGWSFQECHEVELKSFVTGKTFGTIDRINKT